jgi:hypothetical protein
MSDLAKPTLSSSYMANIKKKKILSQLNSMISDTEFNREFKEKVLKSLLGEYTQEDVERARQEQEEILRQIDEEMENKECISATESKVILGSAKEISQQYIEHEYE